jgi:branched-chain amino acid transport system substrate-binding protein
VEDGLAASHAAMLVKEASCELSEPTVDSQVITLQGSGADTLIIGANPKAASQVLRKAYDLGWESERYLGSTGSSITSGFVLRMCFAKTCPSVRLLGLNVIVQG